MFPDISRHKGSDKLPRIKVSKEKFILMMIENGKSKEDAEMQAKISKILGSSVMIGNQMVKIVESKE